MITYYSTKPLLIGNVILWPSLAYRLAASARDSTARKE